jgi:hypothetical protein
VVFFSLFDTKSAYPPTLCEPVWSYSGKIPDKELFIKIRENPSAIFNQPVLDLLVEE